MIAFAGERVLELEAPIRNDGTKATLASWGRTQGEVEEGGRRLEPSMVRECFEYLFSKVEKNIILFCFFFSKFQNVQKFDEKISEQLCSFKPI